MKIEGEVITLDEKRFLVFSKDGMLVFDPQRGITPMTVLLYSVAGCTAYDVKEILKKMRQDVVYVKVEVRGQRRKEHPRVYTKVHLKYKVHGNVDNKKLQDAIKMSLEKYCSASNQLRLGGTEITWDYEII